MNTRIIMKRIFSILLTAVLVFAGIPLMPGVVKGDTVNDVKYQKASVDPTTHAVTYTNATASNCTVVTGNDSTWGDDGNNWYVVNTNVEIADRISVNGEVNLILYDGKTLTSSKGITVNAGNTLNIYAQSGGTGGLSATGGNNEAGIGGTDQAYSCGTITINGGNVTATGGNFGAGIGGGSNGGGGTITINGGTVKANGGRNGAGIGGGNGGNSGTIEILGGTIEATGNSAAGIGGGMGGSGETITIYGSTVKANGGTCGAGIGGSNNDGTSVNAAAGTITINDGTVTAIGGTSSAGIGGGYKGAGGTVTINGGTVTATGGDAAAGIGAGEKGSLPTAPSDGALTAAKYMVVLGGNVQNSTERSAVSTTGSTSYNGKRYPKMRVLNKSGNKTTSFTVTLEVQNGKWNDDTHDDKIVTLTRLSDEDLLLKLEAEDIPAVGDKPDDGYKVGTWKPEPSINRAISKNETYIYTYASNSPTPTPPSPTHTHSYTATVVSQPDCTHTGITEYKCSCGSSYQTTTPALGHDLYLRTIKKCQQKQKRGKASMPADAAAIPRNDRSRC